MPTIYPKNKRQFQVYLDNYFPTRNRNNANKLRSAAQSWPSKWRRQPNNWLRRQCTQVHLFLSFFSYNLYLDLGNYLTLTEIIPGSGEKQPRKVTHPTTLQQWH